VAPFVKSPCHFPQKIMLDLKFIRQNADLVQQHLAHKGIEDGAQLVQNVIELDAARRESLVQSETLKKSRNDLSGQVARARKNGENADDLMHQSREIGEKIVALEASEREIEARLDALLL